MAVDGRGGMCSGEGGATTMASPGLSPEFGASASIVDDQRSAFSLAARQTCVCVWREPGLRDRGGEQR